MTAGIRSDALAPRHPLPVTGRERLALTASAFALITFFALLYALRGGIAALDRGDHVNWRDQVVVSLAVWWTCLPLIPFLAWLVRAFPLEHPRLAGHAALQIGGTLLAAVVRHYALTPVVVWVSGVPDSPASAVARTLTYFTTFLVMIGLLHGVKFHRGLRARELEAAELARSLSEARLAALRAQLQPHFVFNALNAIAALVHTDSVAADRMLTRFAALLRAVLEGGVADTHALHEELEVARQYVELMQMRFGERLRVTWEVDESLRQHPVPWMVLQPLIENAIEHGLGDRQGPGTVHVAVRRTSDGLALIVEDDGLGLMQSHAEGVGLGNTRRRLVQLYGDGASLHVEPMSPRGTRAMVEVPVSSVAA
jgi:two-component system, LytTR family, sensor kinase